MASIHQTAIQRLARKTTICELQHLENTRHLPIPSWGEAERASKALFNGRFPQTLFMDSRPYPRPKGSSSGLGRRGKPRARSPQRLTPSKVGTVGRMGDIPTDSTCTQVNVGTLPSNNGPNSSCTPNLATPTQKHTLCSQPERQVGSLWGGRVPLCVCVCCLIPPL